MPHDEKSLKDKVVEKFHNVSVKNRDFVLNQILINFFFQFQVTEVVGEKFEQAKEKLGYGKCERQDCSDKECGTHVRNFQIFSIFFGFGQKMSNS